VDGIYDHIGGIRQNGVPSILWHMECYHYETRYRTVTSRDANGNMTSRTESYQVKVVTWTGSANFQYSSWRDLSTDVADLAEYQITRVRFYKYFVFADDNTRNSYFFQKQYFINVNNRDTHYNFSESFDILGYIGRAISKTTSEIPLCLNVCGYLFISLFMVEVFYTYWLIRISPKKTFTYTKEFRC